MSQQEPTEWRKQILLHLERAHQDPHSALHQQAQELIKNIKDQHEQEQQRRKLLEETFSAFEIQLMTGAYDQQSLDEIDAQIRDIVLIKHNLLIFDHYIEVYRPTLLVYARTLTSLIEPEDLLADASLVACKAFNKHPQLAIENLDAWFHRILQNTSKNKYREATAQKRGPAESLEDLEQEYSFEIEDGEDNRPEMVLLLKESQEVVMELIMQLPPSYRRTMTLHLLHDWPAQQIASRLKLSVNTIKSHIRRSLPLLRIGFLHRQVDITYLNRKDELDGRLLTLPSEPQQIMRLFVTLGPNYQEIAKRLGPPHTPDTVTACIERYLPVLDQWKLDQGL
jgi:RNA polymerase sigma factor (sigma-70 family)